MAIPMRKKVIHRPDSTGNFGDTYFQTTSITELLVSSWNPILGLNCAIAPLHSIGTF